MSILSNISMKLKVLIIFIIPAVALIVFAVNSISQKNNTMHETHILKEAVELAVDVSALIHETQKERGLSASFVGSAGGG